jgi:hypothetical protein
LGQAYNEYIVMGWFGPRLEDGEKPTTKTHAVFVHARHPKHVIEQTLQQD